MEYFKLALMGGAVVVSAAGVLLYERLNRRRAERILQGRPGLDAAGFGQAYFGDSSRRAKLAAEARGVLAEHVPYSLAGLGPDDAFVQDLRMDALDSMSTVEFALGLEERFGIKIPDADAERILTFRQLLDYLDTHVPKEWAARGSERPSNKWMQLTRSAMAKGGAALAADPCVRPTMVSSMRPRATHGHA